ncbi:MAG: response regulator transcription factor [Culturomica sp.]|jgi:DNA-binding NarL/FixJ family response regulator|nr:response regulator transcription factor [Culturomica sp.]
MTAPQRDILLVDDHSLILTGISGIVERIPEINRVFSATSFAGAVKWIDLRRFDIYLLDIELPDGNGFDLIKRIRAKDPDARIIINTMHEEVWTINRLVECRVDSIILKSSDTAVVEHAVRAVINGCSYCCPRFEHIHRRLRRDKNTELPGDTPTKRELEVLKAIVKGLNTSEIATQLGISINTVETHRKQLFLKFGVRNVVELTMKAISRGWATVE